MYLLQGNQPIVGYRKLAWYEILPLQYDLLAGCVVLFLSTLVVGRSDGWPQAGRALHDHAWRARRAGWRGGLACNYILFLILFVVGNSDVSHGSSPQAQAALAVALVATA